MKDFSGKVLFITGGASGAGVHSPIPPDGHDEKELGVLPIVRYSGR
jgi:hypothetical protein